MCELWASDECVPVGRALLDGGPAEALLVGVWEDGVVASAGVFERRDGLVLPVLYVRLRVSWPAVFGGNRPVGRSMRVIRSIAGANSRRSGGGITAPREEKDFRDSESRGWLIMLLRRSNVGDGMERSRRELGCSYEVMKWQ